MREPESRYTQTEGSLDELAKGLASGTVSRRKALRMLGAAVVGGALASFPGVAWAARCPRPQIRCAGQCCAEGVTTCQGTGRNKTCGPIGCPGDPRQFVDCGGGCTDLAKDPNNCGACGVVCPQAEICNGGACVGCNDPGFVTCVQLDTCIPDPGCIEGQIYNKVTCQCENIA